MLCSTAAMMQSQPVEIPMITISNMSGQCLHYDDRQVVHDNLLNSIIYPFFNGSVQPKTQCGPGLWRRAFYLNVTASDQSVICLGDWSPVIIVQFRGCADPGAEHRCPSAFSDIFTAYSKVCGRIIGERIGTPDAFHGPRTTIEGNYLDGISVTHEASDYAHIFGHLELDTQLDMV